MIHKELYCEGGCVRVETTFTLPAALWAEQIYLVGDFNDWNRHAHPLARNSQGEWLITVRLEPNRAYQFRYLIDGERWLNDDQADAYTRNFHGSDNFLVITDPNFRQYIDK